MNILVTGGAGYIGSHTVLALLEAGYPITVIDNLSNSKEISLQRVQEITGISLQFHKVDLLDPAVIIPAGYSQLVLDGKPAEITLILDSGSNAGNTIQGEIQSASNRLLSAAQIARVNVQMLETQKPFPGEEARSAHFDKVLGAAIAGWDQSPVMMKVSQTGEEKQVKPNSFSHSSPGMTAQFAIVGLMGAASIIVIERKTHSMQRLLTTPIRRYEIVAGHFLAMFVMILIQLIVLILLGQIVYKLDYFGEPLGPMPLMSEPR